MYPQIFCIYFYREEAGAKSHSFFIAYVSRLEEHDFYRDYVFECSQPRTNRKIKEGNEDKNA